MSYPFRIERHTPIRTEAVAALPGAQQQLSDYISRLIKLIPTEIVGLYLTVRGFWKGSAASPANTDLFTFLSWWPVLCVILLWFSRAWGTRRAGGSWDTVQLVPILISTVSFLIWIYAVGDAIFGWQVAPPYVSTALVVWVFLVPYIYPDGG